MKQENLYFILVRPNFLGNIGSVARVLKNFGFENLRLVAPPKNYKDAEARKMSVGAFELLKKALVFENLSDALQDINLVVGTTCAKQRDLEPETPREFLSSMNLASSNRMAIVFGDERDGLKRQELETCHHLLRIPTAETFPSMNLAQAVGIVAYELSEKYGNDHGLNRGGASAHQAGLKEANAGDESASGSENELFFGQLDEFLHEIGFTKSFNRSSVMQELRSLYYRSRPSSRQTQLLQSMLDVFKRSRS